MLQPVSDCAMILGHNVDTEGRCIKFVLFFTSRCVFWKRKAAGWKLKESCATRMPRMWFGYGKNVIGKIP